MIAREPQLRRRGFFLHSSDSEPDSGDHENPEGFIVRVRFDRSSRSSRPRQIASSGRHSGGRQRREDFSSSEGHPEIRSGSVTGSRQRAHSPR